MVFIAKQYNLRQIFVPVLHVFKATLCQAKNHQKSLFFFWLLIMSVICEHVRILELRKSVKFRVAVVT